jgi:ribose 5-phosphate isomerase A
MQWNSKLLAATSWANSITNKAAKQKVAEQIAAKVTNGDVIGVGSGSTALLALYAIADKIKREQLAIQVIPTSIEIGLTCGQLGLTVTNLNSNRPDWLFDGADEVDPAHNLIKGRGGAMFKEKLLIQSCPQCFIIIDESKLVEKLGQKFPVPVEIFPAAIALAEFELLKLGATNITVRPAGGKDGPVITENGNLILDVHFATIAAGLEKEIKSITGVIESGLFMDYPVEVLIASAL